MNVVPLPHRDTKVNDIPAVLRKLADQIEAGEHGEVGTAMILMTLEDGMPIFIAGEPLNHFEGLGMLETAKAHIANDIIG